MVRGRAKRRGEAAKRENVARPFGRGDRKGRAESVVGRWSIAVAALCIAPVVPVAALQQDARSFDIEAQDAAAAIRLFARQSGIQILVAEAATRGKRSAPVRGTMPVRAALDRLLRGTGLEIASYDGRTAALRPS